MTTTTTQGPWHKTTAELIIEAKAKIVELGFEVDGEAYERWEGDGVMELSPKERWPATHNRCWYLTILGTDGVDKGWIDEPGVCLVSIRPKHDEDLQVTLKDWGHLTTLLLEEGYIKVKATSYQPI